MTALTAPALAVGARRALEVADALVALALAASDLQHRPRLNLVPGALAVVASDARGLRLGALARQVRPEAAALRAAIFLRRLPQVPVADRQLRLGRQLAGQPQLKALAHRL